MEKPGEERNSEESTGGKAINESPRLRRFERLGRGEVPPRIAEPVAPVPNLYEGQHLCDAGFARRPNGVRAGSREVAPGSDRG